ncbi:bifunctional diaminohydroxyphosphoribosylaminopyrimidine deaminase/5-amino-6-(5-phosphoribosylamino)uracil reductase RibD [Plastorhodobacter daqingensis]|uniref:Riboflavin biosynthesis protein RibD n=1 Tax=Plastorhodobacter daqingensis TaxID=1387281 RepID=A0ABW2UJ22_9RHOB
MTAEADRRFMRLALTLGARGMGNVWPNPAVGCVIVREGRIVGRGWTQPGGRPHAEVIALAAAGAAARGATAYVSLEPCAHHGRTPPCCDALAAAGVARVVTALEDPDPRVAGRGHDMLRRCGIAITTGVEAEAARRDHCGFLSRVQRGRPMVTLKLASSFDGRIATASGESQWITGAPARRLVHAQRARHDAVLVGGGTARADDPMLTVRGLGARHQPLRLVASRHLALPVDGALARSAGDVPLWLLHEGGSVPAALCERWQDLGARLVPVPLGPGRQLDPKGMLEVLGAEGLTRVFCEGGGQLAASLLAQGLVDELVGFTAGLALGAEGQPSIGALGIGALAEAPRFRLAEAQAVGPDIMHRWVAL